MRRGAAVLVTLVLLALLCASISAQVAARKPRAKAAPRPAAKRETRSPASAPAMVKAEAGPLELPPQPEPQALAAPDLIVTELKFDGPPGPPQPGRRYSVGAVVQNIGQWESGAFLTRLSVRVQVPSERKDETSVVASGRVESLPPRKTGESSGKGTVWFDYTTGSHTWAQYTFTAVADSTGHIREFDEANNSATSADWVVDTLREQE